ncbi:MAG: phosphate ABC transporter substrate-binding protein [Coriobacteriia bacterium]|nr:phosphate ABC transporter substrate-binding protein [Coriobacteriia bacterium]
MKIKKIGMILAAMAASTALACCLASCGGGDQKPAAENGGSGNAAALSGTVSTNGSTSMEKVVGALSEAFMAENPDVKITYDATGSGTGIESAKNKSCDVGLASRALKDEETGLASTTVALDGIVVIVNSESGVKDLSMEQITGLFTGKIKNWKEVGGADLEVSCIGRENGSGTRDGFESVTDTKDACKLDQELTSTGAVITAVASSKNAVGYASFSSLEGQEGITAVTVGGVECTEDTILDGTYAIQRPFNFIVAEDAQLSDAAQAFADFAVSPAAADLIRAAGAVPAPQGK